MLDLTTKEQCIKHLAEHQKGAYHNNQSREATKAALPIARLLYNCVTLTARYLVIYVSEAGAFYGLVKDKVKDMARLAKDLVKAGLPKDWVFETAGDSRLPEELEPLAFDRVGYYDGTNKKPKARVEEEEESESEENNNEANDTFKPSCV